MNKALYVEYATLEAQKDAIELKQSELKFQIMEEMKAGLADGQNGVEISQGSFTLQQKTTYKFTKVIADIEATLKKRKQEEIAMGVARPEKVTEYVTFRPTKAVVAR